MSKTQNHIHLSTTLGGYPEFAPDITWKVIDRLEVPTVFVSLKRTLTGRLRAHRLRVNGEVVQLSSMNYTVVVQPAGEQGTEERLNDLKAMQGHPVYLVDNVHCDDGLDHTPYIRPMFLARVAEPVMFDKMLFRYHVDIELEDASL